MSAYLRDDKRRIVPRWRPSQTARLTGEMSPTRTSADVVASSSDLEELAARVREFNTYRTPAFAVDLVGSAFAIGRPEVAQPAAEVVLAHPTSSGPARALARQILSGEPTQVPSDRPEELRLRRLLRLYPQNPLLWTDLALLRVAAADLRGARRWLEVALRLAPSDRFVLRSAARYWIHADEPDRAHALLRRAPGLLNDPWLLAAEMAAADIAEQTQRSIRVARQMVQSGHYAPIHTAELATAIATEEWLSGRMPRARRWFRRALVAPTENALAQAVWMARRDQGLQGDIAAADASGAWEAGAIHAFSVGRWRDAVDYSREWQRDEPFSSRPAVLGGFAAAVALNDYGAAHGLLRGALRANPRDFTLLNNQAFALASENRVAEAVRSLGRIRSDVLNSEERAVLTATQGLVRFRLGSSREGAALYREAIAEAERLDKPHLKALATVFLAREQRRIGLPDAEETINDAKAQWKSLQGHRDQAIAEAVLAAIPKPAPETGVA